MRGAALVQTVMLALVAAFGLLAAVAVAGDWLQGLDTWFWQETTCTVEASRAVERAELGDHALDIAYRYRYRGESRIGSAYRHGVGGFELASEAAALASRYAPGEEVRCWVDPDRPDRSYLERADLWQGLWVLVPLLFLGVGAGGLWLIHGPGLPEPGRAEDAAGGRRKAGFGIGLMIVLFGLFLLFGAGFLLPFFVWPALQVLEARSWQAVPCTIESSRVVTQPGEDGATYSVDLLFRYQIGGREYRSNRYRFLGGSSSGYDPKAEVVAALPAGAVTTCWVDPDDPFEAVVERGLTAEWLFGLVPLLFVLVGAGGLAFTVAALRGARQEAARPSWGAGSEARAGDESATLVLEPTLGPFGKLGCALGLTLFWNGFIGIFVWFIVQEWRAGNPQWFPALILTPFVLIGLLFLFAIPWSVLALLNPRPRVHLTPATLRAGEPAQIEWAFRGFAGRLRRLSIRLEASETRVRERDSGVSIESAPLDTPAIEILDRGPELPLDYGSAAFTIPPGTPPSSAGYPSVSWKLKLQGEIAFWPDVVEEYEVRIR